MKIYSTRREEEVLETSQRIVVKDKAHSKARLVAEFLTQLKTDPTNTLVLVAREKATLLGFVWVVAPQGVPYVFIWWAMGRGHVSAELLRLVGSWATGLGRLAIRSETTGRVRALGRRWSFKPVATVVELTLSDLSRAVLKRR